MPRFPKACFTGVLGWLVHIVDKYALNGRPAFVLNLLGNSMGQHYLASSAVRDLSLDDISFSSELEALRFLAKIRWRHSDKQVCTDCGAFDKHYFIKTRKQWRCKHCFHTFSITSGTIFADRKISYRKMIFGIYEYISSSNGISALGLSRKIGVNPKTAWLLIHKLRESIIHHRDLRPLGGVVQIDGTYVGGKPRKSRIRNFKNHDVIRNKIESRRKNKKKMSRNDARNYYRRKHFRRLIIVLREIHDQSKKGGKRTIVISTMGEKEEFVKPLVKRYIQPGATIMTDENGAYNFLSASYEHYTVEHSKEYSTADGINNNQAESYNSRLKRWYYGIGHRMTPQYTFDYACEMAWREDMRRVSEKGRFESILGKAFISKPSKWWRRYHQGHKRNDELLMYIC